VHSKTKLYTYLKTFTSSAKIFFYDIHVNIERSFFKTSLTLCVRVILSVTFGLIQHNTRLLNSVTRILFLPIFWVPFSILDLQTVPKKSFLY